MVSLKLWPTKAFSIAHELSTSAPCTTTRPALASITPPPPAASPPRPRPARPGDLVGARTRFERALAIYEARLGPDHPDTMRSRRSLAALTAELDNSQ